MTEYARIKRAAWGLPVFLIGLLRVLIVGTGEAGAMAGPTWIAAQAHQSPTPSKLEIIPNRSTAGLDGVDGLEVNVRTYGLWVEALDGAGEPQTRLRLEGEAGRETRSGGPDLPVLRWAVEVPLNAQPSLESGPPDELRLSLAELGLPETIEVLSPEVCKCIQPQPAVEKGLPADVQPPLVLGATYVSAGRRFVTIEARPLAVDPVSGELLLRTSLSGQLLFGQNVSMALQAAERLEVQGGSLAGSLPGADRLDPLATPAAVAQGGYLVIGPEAFRAAMQPFIRLKQAQGYAVQFTSLEQVGSSQVAIQDYVRKAYLTGSPRPAYLLLVGDIDAGALSMPGWTGQSTKRITDLYYTTVDGSDSLPDLAVGRLPARGLEQAAAYAQRAVEFAGRGGVDDWFKRASFLATCDPSYYELVEASHLSVINGQTGPFGLQGFFPTVPQPGGDRLFCNTYSAGYSQVQAMLSSGRGLVTYSGHGNIGDWELGIHESNVKSLAAPGVQPLVGSFACQTGDFQAVRSLGEAWLWDGNAIAFYGASDDTFWHVDDLLQRALFQSFFTNPSTSDLAGALRDGLQAIHRYEPVLGAYYQEIYNILGDPSVRPFAPPEIGRWQLSTAQGEVGVCAGGQATTSVQADVQPFYAVLNPLSTSLSVSGLPAGVSTSLAGGTLKAPGSGLLQFTANAGAAPGVYPLRLAGSGLGSVDLTLRVASHAPLVPRLSQPVNGALNVDPRPLLSWEAVPGAQAYTLQIAYDREFNQLVETASGLGENSYRPGVALEHGQRYFWRVQAHNACGQPTSIPSEFTVSASPLACGNIGMPAPLLRETFEAGSAPGWSAGAGWALVAGAGDASSTAYRLDVPAEAGVYTLVSPSVNLPASESASLTFWQRRDFEGSPAACFDAARIEISVDGGSTWQPANNQQFLAGGYDGQARPGNELAGSAAWCGGGGSQRSSLDLSAYAGKRVQFRFHLASDASGGAPAGWTIDTLAVQSCQVKTQTEGFFQLWLPILNK